ncbi:MAG: hypothetical protein IT385_17705 [Deltaproteobacteria bacterium]|nr:hypothetical protein [Deltaproteobacteria bacterium]
MQITMVPPDLRALDDNPSDVIVLGTFADERPLEGVTGLVDWRLCGAISSWKLGGLVSGVYGEQLVYPTRGRLSHPTLLLLGLGTRAEHRSDRAFAMAQQAIRTASGLGASSITLGLLGLEQLASPLERTGTKLMGILREACTPTRDAEARLGRVTLIASVEEQRLIRDGMAFYAARAGA